MKLCKLAFRHEHILDAAKAPRGQLPYILDGDDAIGDSDAIIAHLIARYALPIDDGLDGEPARYGPSDPADARRSLLGDVLLALEGPALLAAVQGRVSRTHPGIVEADLETARAYNFKRYHYQGIGRYEPEAAYARGIADLQVLADLVPGGGFIFGAQPCSCDAGIYGFTANIYFYEIDTPLKDFLMSRPNLVAHCRAVHDALDG